MDTETLKRQGLTELQEIIGRLGGWPVVEGEEWKGEENFKWYELSSKAAGEGHSVGDIINIGKDENIIQLTTNTFIPLLPYPAFPALNASHTFLFQQL